MNLCLGVPTLTHKRHLREGKVLPDADPGPTVERHVLPRPGRPVLPPLWAKNIWVRELFRRRRIQVLAALHAKCAVKDDVTLKGLDVGLAKLAGQARVLDCDFLAPTSR